MKTRRVVKILFLIVLISTIHSFLPVASLYLKKTPTLYTNKEAVEKLKDNRGDYFEFVAFGDNHAGLIFNDSSTLKLIRRINREDRFNKIPIDFVLVLGDVTFRGSEWDYRIYNKVRSLIRRPVISAIGNHDDDKGGSSHFKKYIGETEFSFIDRGSYFIVLNNTVNDLTDKQFAWFEEELKKALAYKHRFIIIHKAPISLYQQSWFRPELSPWSYRFMKMCQEHKVDIVFSGHEHMFKEASYGGVKYIMSGGGGMLTLGPGPEGGFLHYIVVRVYGDYVDYEVRKIFPPFWEFLTYYMWKDFFYLLKDLFF